MGFLFIFLKWIFLLLLGVFFVLLFFYFKNKKNKSFSSDIKKLIKYKNIIYDKELHENFLLKESYISSVERLKNFLLKIYKSKNNYFNLTPLDALMLIEIFPFDIRKSKDGKYYIINQKEFELFLKLLLNKNTHFISNESLLELRDKLVKKLLSWDDKIVIDVNFIFNLIKSDNIPDDNIENQKFITLATRFNNEKILFKIEDLIKNDNDIENTNYKKTNKKNAIKKDEVLIKGKDKDYIIDLKRGIQYVINKVSRDEKKESKEDKLNKLLENLTLLIASQPQQIADSIQEIITKTNFSNLDENSLKKLLKEEIVKKTENNQNNSQILNTTNKLLDDIFGKEPNIPCDVVHKNDDSKENIVTTEIEPKTEDKNKNNKNENKKDEEVENKKDTQINKLKNSNKKSEDSFKEDSIKSNSLDDTKNKQLLIEDSIQNNNKSVKEKKDEINFDKNELTKELDNENAKNNLKNDLLSAISSDSFIDDFGMSSISKQSEKKSQKINENKELKEVEIENLDEVKNNLQDEISATILKKYFLIENRIEDAFIEKILNDVLIRSEELAFYQIDKTYYLKLKDFLHSILFIDFGIKISNLREKKIIEIIENIDCKKILTFVRNIYSNYIEDGDFIPIYLVVSLSNNEKEIYIPFVYKVNEEFYKIKKEKKNIFVSYKNSKKVIKC